MTENTINSNMKVLITDDLPTARKVMRKLLSQIGFINIEEADNGLSALSAIEKNQYDLIIMDWNMPKMNGLQVVEAARKKENYKHTPIIMATANNTKEHVVQAIEKGASDYVTKPYSAEILKKKIEAAISKMQQGQ